MKYLLLIPALITVNTALAQTCPGGIQPTTPTTAFTTHDNGTVIHKKTGLMWRRCLLGQSWDGATCSGTASVYTWQQALQAVNSFADYSDWRLPNKNELASLVERACIDPAINLTVFPNAPASVVWSSSPYANHSGAAWFVYVNDGLVSASLKTSNLHVRLVRGGQ